MSQTWRRLSHKPSLTETVSELKCSLKTQLRTKYFCELLLSKLTARLETWGVWSTSKRSFWVSRPPMKTWAIPTRKKNPSSADKRPRWSKVFCVRCLTTRRRQRAKTLSTSPASRIMPLSTLVQSSGQARKWRHLPKSSKTLSLATVKILWRKRRKLECRCILQTGAVI